jgi:hypothetical protein
MSRHHYRPSYEITSAVTDMKYRLNKAFAAMRAMGLIARQNYECCSSCAGYAITEDAVIRVNKGKKVNGSVFYHHQDTESFLDGETLHIRFGQLDSQQLGPIGLDTTKVGALVLAALEAAGLEPYWNGSPDSTITLSPEEHAVKMSYERDQKRAV